MSNFKVEIKWSIPVELSSDDVESLCRLYRFSDNFVKFLIGNWPNEFTKEDGMRIIDFLSKVNFARGEVVTCLNSINKELEKFKQD